MNTATEKKTDPRTVQLKRVRLSFADGLIEKKKAANTDDATEKYSCNLLIETDQPHCEENKAKVMGAIEAAGEEKWKKRDKWRDIAEDNKKRVCFRKGDTFKNQDTGDVYQGYAGNWALSCGTPNKGQKRPKLMDRKKRDLVELVTDKVTMADLIEEICYGGVYADAIVSFFGTDKGGNGIFCTIDAIRSHQEGEKMGGGGIHVTADMFADLDDGGDDLLGPEKKPAGSSMDDLLG